MKLTTPPSVVRVNGLNGTDNISGRGMFGSPTSMHLQLAGGSGNDYLEGGLLAGDRLQGDDGDDGFFTRNGQRGDIVTGGLGVDHATIDVSDQASGDREVRSGHRHAEARAAGRSRSAAARPPSS